jgi:hypothetical protein
VGRGEERRDRACESENERERERERERGREREVVHECTLCFYLQS